MKKLLPSNYFETQDRLCEWFEDLKRTVGCGENADIGAVLRKVEAMGRKIETYEEQQVVVAKWRGYRFWGDCYNAAVNELPEAKPLELGSAWNKCPAKWVRKMGWDKAEKQLPKTHKVAGKALAAIEERAKSEGPEWAEEMRDELLRIFEASSDHLQFEERVTDFIYPEEDPATTWVLIADEAAAVLERSADLPTTAVEELIAYAYEAEVEMTKKGLASIEESEFRGNRFFDYLLTACIYKQSRASSDEVTKTSSLVGRAFSYWGCYNPTENQSGCYEEESANDPLRPEKKRRVYNPDITVDQIERACREVYRLDEEGKTQHITHDDVAEAVRAAVKPPEAGKALTTTEKK